MTSPPATFAEYCRRFDAHTIISLMVGDLQRIDVYPDLGFQAPEAIPGAVRAAFERLVGAGYTGHLLR